MLASAGKIRIFIADEHNMFRESLRELIETDPDLCVVGEAANGNEVLSKLIAAKPDLLLLDLDMPKMNGLEILSAIKAIPVEVRTIVLATAMDKPVIIEAVRLGARGVLMKEMNSPLVFKSIHAVMAGEYWVGHDVFPDIIPFLEAGAATAVNNVSALSPREWEITAAVAEGLSNKGCAAAAGLSDRRGRPAGNPRARRRRLYPRGAGQRFRHHRPPLPGRNQGRWDDHGAIGGEAGAAARS